MRERPGLNTLFRPISSRHVVTVLSVAALAIPVLAAPVAAAAAAGCIPRVIDLGTLGGSSSEILETNGRGVWVGTALNAAEVPKAVTWENGTIRDLGTVGEAEGDDVNNSGVVVGSHRMSDDWATTRAFMWRHGVLRDLQQLPGGGFTSVRRLNNRGDAVGSAADASGAERAVVWPRGGSPVVLAMPVGYLGSYGMAINDAGDVVGGAYKEDQLIAWGWDRNGSNHPLAELDRNGFSQANVLDNQGRAAGLSDFGGNPGAQAALWRNGHERSLGTFGDSDFSFALGTNWQGDYVGVGGYFLGENRGHVFLTSASSTGPLRTLMPLSGNPADGSGAHAVTGGNVTVGGASDTAAGETHATVWTCAYQQAFVPDVAQSAIAKQLPHRVERSIVPSQGARAALGGQIKQAAEG